MQNRRLKNNLDFQGDREGRPYNTTKRMREPCIVRATLAVALEAGSHILDLVYQLAVHDRDEGIGQRENGFQLFGLLILR